MPRLSGPRGWEIRNASAEFVKSQFHDAVFNFITSMPKEERWLWGRQIEEDFERLVESMCYQLDVENPRF